MADVDGFSDSDLDGVDWDSVPGMRAQPDVIQEEFEFDEESLEWANRIEEAFTQRTQGEKTNL